MLFCGGQSGDHFQIMKTNTVRLAGCVILKNQSILLLHRVKRDFYELPGGKVEPNETPKKAAIREIKEELLLDITIVRKLGTTEFTDEEKKFFYTWFLATAKENQAPQIGEKKIFDHFRFIPIDELTTYSLSSNMQNFLEALRSGKIRL